MKKQTRAGGPRTDREPVDSVERLLRARSAEITGAWCRLLCECLPAANRLLPGEQQQLARDLFEELLSVLRGELQGRRRSMLTDHRHLMEILAGPPEGHLPGFIQFVLSCSESLQELIGNATLVGSPNTHSADSPVKRLDMACAILIHREAHAFAGRCGQMLRSIDSCSDVTTSHFIPQATNQQQSA